MHRSSSLWLALFLAACGKPPEAEKVPAEAPPAEPRPAAADDGASAPVATPEPGDAPQTGRKLKPSTFEEQLANLDKQIEGYLQIAERNGKSASAYGRVASLVLGRARLSGDYDDYARAEALIEKGFAVSPTGKSGPFMVRARLNYTLHRLDRVDEDFEMASRLPTKDAQVLHTREQFAGNLAFQRGQYETALQLLQSADARRSTLSSLASLALYHWKSASFDEAEALYLKALAAYRDRPTEPAAWIHLQLGLMDLDRGRYDEALEHYRDGERLIAGYWLIEEHIAEILTLTGKTEEAKKLYLSIIERTDNPEFMDAMAEIHLAAGQTDEAEQWLARAQARFDAQMARFPEAAYGHALEHFLAHGKDPAQAVDMAEKNHALRPNADAKRLLAEAYLGAERTDDAKRVIEEALATPMRSADLHATAAAIYEKAGETAKAAEQRAAARAINPKIEES